MTELPEKSNFQQERIICAAIHYKDPVARHEQPINIRSGIVVCGRRHNNCMYIHTAITGCFTVKEEIVMGFLTNKDRFVDRTEAYKIALKAGQIEEKDNAEERDLVLNVDGKPHHTDPNAEPILISEDLY